MNPQRHHHDPNGDPSGRYPRQAWGHDESRRGRGHDDPRLGRPRGGRPGFGPFAGGRARRGDVQTAVLRLLAESPMHGYQVIQELAGRSGGAWNPGPGSVYPTLQAMEEQDLVTSEMSGSKRVFSLTDTGRKAAEAGEAGAPRSPWDDMAEASGPRIELRQALHGLMAAAHQVERTGTDDQIGKAIEHVDQARKAIYLLLAE
jgi:DNA-binding PadR family transcriptional regulator